MTKVYQIDLYIWIMLAPNIHPLNGLPCYSLLSAGASI
jgi:hypothetical protein